MVHFAQYVHVLNTPLFTDNCWFTYNYNVLPVSLPSLLSPSSLSLHNVICPPSFLSPSSLSLHNVICPPSFILPLPSSPRYTRECTGCSDSKGPATADQRYWYSSLMEKLSVIASTIHWLNVCSLWRCKTASSPVWQMEWLTRLGPRSRPNPSTDRFQYHALYWKQYTWRMRSGDETNDKWLEFV